MKILSVHRGDIFTIGSEDSEFALRVLDVGRGAVEIGVEHDESLRVVPETCDDPKDVRLAVYPR